MKLSVENMVKATGNKIGFMRSARMGVFQIRLVNSTEISDLGMNDASFLEKSPLLLTRASVSSRNRLFECRNSNLKRHSTWEAEIADNSYDYRVGDFSFLGDQISGFIEIVFGVALEGNELVGRSACRQ